MLVYQTCIQIYDQISILGYLLEVKLRRSISLELGLKGSKQLSPLQKLACTFLYRTGIQIYDQISTPIIWSKVKLHHLILLRFGLKEGKMAEKLETNATFQALVSPSFPMVQNSSKSHKNRCPCLSLKCVPKCTFKTQL